MTTYVNDPAQNQTTVSICDNCQIYVDTEQIQEVGSLSSCADCAEELAEKQTKVSELLTYLWTYKKAKDARDPKKVVFANFAYETSARRWLAKEMDLELGNCKASKFTVQQCTQVIERIEALIEDIPTLKKFIEDGKTNESGRGKSKSESNNNANKRTEHCSA